MTNFLQDTDSTNWPESGLNFDSRDLTTSSERHANTFRLRGESNPTRQVRKIVSKIENSDVIKQLDKLLSIIDEIFNVTQQSVDLSSIPPLNSHIDEDGSVFLEWIFPDFRIGFNIEPNPEDSGWHILSNKKLGERTESGQLAENMNVIILRLLDFILNNI